jgi:lysophospholipase L1-like esterase
MFFLMAGVLGMAVMPVAAPSVEVVGDWQVRVMAGTVTVGKNRVKIKAPVTLSVPPATVVHVKDERYDGLPLFSDGAAPWAKGVKLKELTTFETTAADMLIPESFVLKNYGGDGDHFKLGTDYALEGRWATLGRLRGGIEADKVVWADYDMGRGRLDSVVVNRKGEVRLVSGEPHNATPKPLVVAAEEIVLANIWVPGRLQKLTADNLYPITEPVYHAPKSASPPAVQLLPKTWALLHGDKPLHIMAWGDSVTDGGQASGTQYQYQSRFVTLLKQKFPQADVHLTTVAWGGRNTDSFLNEPPGSPHNFAEKVLAARPDLIVMEFVNDAYMTPEVVEQKYSALLKQFQEIGAEWVILTPHFVRPDWMGAASVRVETDPRPYVAGLRQFAAKHKVALADASLHWGHLLKEGIPYTTLLSNSINHPDDRGHEIFAQSLMELFEK